ncbi:aminoglycoside phosphotransferase family protein [Pseudomonas paraeruginosa]|uniref:3'-kinase n=2 Tax=Pseudomonas aeruginosa group TaxID=136841 RepID=A0ABD7JYJ0_PSEAI|nr:MULTISPECIES: aminoglycoside phosphotransferase family protein [Pseudomonas aeruginosa group]KFF34816.1 3'-kinase [Pseudomonas aeruginosa VRFPA01]ABR82218.1 streptomycin 3''-kinase (Streptomycin 3''-phosphotransferase) (SPH) [Pseudomonas aeruginosa PA7]KAB0748349.1 3'-kinase [Pseudomonas aeruginosa]KSC50058.1 3'-kinase [Pseudomonas paraeruginosa]KSC93994.1 3'-kinase [Pseudomonas aeruginosa]
MNERLDFSPYLERWALQPDGAPFATHSSHLLPVRHRGAPAMLKIACAEEERFGHVLLNWWDGQGAARVLAHDEQALLMERATGTRSLLQMVERGEDEQATRILCQAIERIHVPRPGPLPELVPLERWFDSLYAAERRYGGLYVDAADAARHLLATAREQRPLHGDIHHGNVLDFGARGWLVIDPKRLYGERGYDYANLFTNPDAKTAQAPGRFERQLDIVVAASGLERHRLLLWILAWAGLSAAWFDEDGSHEETAAELVIARLALDSLFREA